MKIKIIVILMLIFSILSASENTRVRHISFYFSELGPGERRIYYQAPFATIAEFNSMLLKYNDRFYAPFRNKVLSAYHEAHPYLWERPLVSWRTPEDAQAAFEREERRYQEFLKTFNMDSTELKRLEADSVITASFEFISPTTNMNMAFIEEKIQTKRQGEKLIFYLADLSDLEYFEQAPEIENPYFGVLLGPNPIVDQLRLTILNPGLHNLDKIVNVEILNGLNVVVKNIRFPIINSAIMERHIDITDLSPGIFFIVVKIEGEREVRYTFTKTAR